ncbi:MAG: hypothetical protein ACRDHW_05765 [Ktedonobacteraceae bacterium]
MTLPILMIGVSLFFLAFVGINKLGPTLFALVAAIGMLFGLYFVWVGLAGSNGNLFIWGSILVLAAAATLIYLKTSFSD